MLFTILEICVTIWLFVVTPIGTYVAVVYISDILHEQYKKLKNKRKESTHE